MKLRRKNSSPRPVLITVGQWLFRRRGWLPLLLAPPLLCNPYREIEHSGISILLSLFLILLGEALRMWAVAYAGSVTRTRIGKLGHLVTEGPYAYVRNPIYWGNILIACGILLLFEQPLLVVPVLLLVFLYYHLIVLWEEDHLEKAFGQPYQDYRRRVARWWPFPQSKRGGKSSPFFLWREVLRSERGTFLTLLGVFLFYSLEEYLEHYQRGHALLINLFAYFHWR